MCIYMMIILAFVYDFALMILITRLDVIFVKTCVYTCITSEPHLIIIALYFIAHLYPLEVLI